MAERTQATRARNLKRTAVLLRWIDPLRVPQARTFDVLERSGRVKEIVFPNNATNEHMKEVLVHAFRSQLEAEDFSR